jgi:hypothetical protein
MFNQFIYMLYGVCGLLTILIVSDQLLEVLKYFFCCSKLLIIYGLNISFLKMYKQFFVLASIYQK